jgi:allantoate deiminase
MAKICPIAMLFVRSPGGISHSPLEQVFVEDVALTLQVAFANLTLLSVQ